MDIKIKLIPICLLILFFQEGNAQKANLPKPNVLFIVVDDLRPELGCYGATYIKSPNIDRLAKEAVRFDRAYCQQAVCSPSRTSFLTGLRPDQTGVYDLETNFRTKLPDVITLPQFFKQHNYFTVGVGKVYHNRALNDPASWSEREWDPMDSIWDIQRGYLVSSNKEMALRNGDGRGPAYEAGPNDQLYTDDLVVDSAIHKMKLLKDKPFFLAVGLSKPHLPFNAPRRFWDLYREEEITLPDTLHPSGSPAYSLANSGELRNYPGMPKGNAAFPDTLRRKLIHGYYACVSYLDFNVGRLINALEENGLAENTIIVLFGDHGWKLGDYGEWCKHTNYEFDTRVPLFIAGPGVKNKNTISGSLVELVDIYPTLAELCHLGKRGDLPGKSLAPILNGNVNKTIKGYAVSQFPRGNLMGYSFRTKQYHLIRWSKNGSPGEIKDIELYDHATDRGEKTNVAFDERYNARLKKLMKETDHFFKQQD